SLALAGQARQRNADRAPVPRANFPPERTPEQRRSADPRSRRAEIQARRAAGIGRQAIVRRSCKHVGECRRCKIRSDTILPLNAVTDKRLQGRYSRTMHIIFYMVASVTSLTNG